MLSELVLPISAASAKKMIFIGNNLTVLSIVGTLSTEVVDIQIPTVESPAEGTDANWTAYKQATAAVTLNAGHNVVELPKAQMYIRLVKAAGVASNAYGVRRS